MHNNPPKIVLFGSADGDRNAAVIANLQRKNEKIKADYDRAVGEVASLIPESLAEADKLAVLYSFFLDTMEYDYDYGENVNESGLVSMPASSRDKYYHPVEGEDAWVDGKQGVLLKKSGCAEGCLMHLKTLRMQSAHRAS